jgi:hypothetical protein
MFVSCMAYDSCYLVYVGINFYIWIAPILANTNTYY